jgi:hypothetical protein
MASSRNHATISNKKVIVFSRTLGSSAQLDHPHLSTH